MKRILVLSDSHSYFDKALKIFEKEKPDIVIAAGDGIGDIDDLSYVHPEATYYMVKGNCDFFERSHSEENIFEIEGKKFTFFDKKLFNRIIFNNIYIFIIFFEIVIFSPETFSTFGSFYFK